MHTDPKFPQQRFLPVRDLDRMHLILGCDLLDGFLPLERFQRHPGFECRVVSSAFGFHLDGLSGCGFPLLQSIAFYSLTTGLNFGVHLSSLGLRPRKKSARTFR